MRIDLLGALQSASGPYGGRANHLKLTTRKDGQILVTHRKTAMTGDKIYGLHAWSRLNWIWLDAYWRALPQNVRAEWGKCSRRTADSVKSNIDEFRAHNMPRAFLGFPALMLPPDRFHSHACYLQRTGPQYPHMRRAPMQVWTDGVMKPEPQPPGEPPVEGVPFTVFIGSEPHPFVPSTSCTWQPCPPNADPCYDDQVCIMPVPFDCKPPYSFLKWHCPTQGEPPHRPIWWLATQRIESARRWAVDRPWEEIWSSSIACRHGMWGNLEIPWPSAWCITLTYDCAPAVLRSDGYYWHQMTSECPRGTWQLAGFRDYYGHYDWQPTIQLDPFGTMLADPPPCVQPESIVWAWDPYTSFWSNFENAERWAGLKWFTHSAHRLTILPSSCGGPAYANATDILCCSSGERKGNWWFKITVMRGGLPYTIEYRKPSTPENPGWAGHYFIEDPNLAIPWATPLMLVAEGDEDWHKKELTIWYVIAKQVAHIIAAELCAAVVVRLFSRMQAWSMLGTPYAYDPMVKAAIGSRHVMKPLQGVTWKCRVKMHVGPQAYSNWQIANEAWKRIRALQRIGPFP